MNFGSHLEALETLVPSPQLLVNHAKMVVTSRNQHVILA